MELGIAELAELMTGAGLITQLIEQGPAPGQTTIRFQATPGQEHQALALLTRAPGVLAVHLTEPDGAPVITAIFAAK
jgi:hypothetical protein